MSNSPKTIAAVVLLGLCAGVFAQGKVPVGSSGYPGIGRAATPQEVAAWDIDVRPDFKGLPKGAGSVNAGQDIWEAKCASCHGVFGESNEVFSPLVGGTTAKDIETGHVARLQDRAFPGRTTLMKVATLSTLWDYIYRAMPWTQPKSLTPDDVYAVTAYLLNLGGIVPDNFTLSDQNMREVQQRLPNRNGMTSQHGMWPGSEFGPGLKADVAAKPCMQNCGPALKVASSLPAHAQGSHGNLADQNRPVGAQRGIGTATPGGAKSPATATPAAASTAKVPQALLDKYSCTACHGMDQKLVGPSFNEISRKYPGKTDYLAGKIRAGGSGVWGAIPMPPQSLGEDEARSIAQWLAAGS